MSDKQMQDRMFWLFGPVVILAVYIFENHQAVCDLEKRVEQLEASGTETGGLGNEQ